MNNHKIPTNFYIDSLQHDILLEKLAHYGLTNKAIARLKSYLSNRKQYIQQSDVRSSVRPISVEFLKDLFLAHFYSTYVLMTSLHRALNSILSYMQMTLHLILRLTLLDKMQWKYKTQLFQSYKKYLNG